MCNICNKPWCGKCPQPSNPSNKTIITGQAGANAYEEFLAYNPDLDPNLNPESPWTEQYWLENYVKGQKGDTGDTPYIGDNGNWWIGDVDTGVSAEPEEASPETDEDIFE